MIQASRRNSRSDWYCGIKSNSLGCRVPISSIKSAAGTLIQTRTNWHPSRNRRNYSLNLRASLSLVSNVKTRGFECVNKQAFIKILSASPLPLLTLSRFLGRYFLPPCLRLGDWTHVLNWIKVWTDKRMGVHGKIFSGSRELDFHATNLGTHPEKCVKTLFYTGTETNMLLTFESRVAKNLSDLKGKSSGGWRERNGVKKHLSLIRCLCLSHSNGPKSQLV